jgi:hypothetical protein
MIYEMYDNPDWLTFDVMDSIILHANKTLNFPDDVYFVIEFTDDINGDGNCDMEEGFVEINVNNMLSKEDTITTIFHELVHAEQIVRGKLVVGHGMVPTKWYNTIYKSTYEELPWEVEAFRLEKQLMESFNGEAGLG